MNTKLARIYSSRETYIIIKASPSQAKTFFSQLAGIIQNISGTPGKLQKPDLREHALLEALAGCNFSLAVWSQPPRRLWIFLRLLNHNLLSLSVYEPMPSAWKSGAGCCVRRLRGINSRSCPWARQWDRNLAALRLGCEHAVSPLCGTEIYTYCLTGLTKQGDQRKHHLGDCSTCIHWGIYWGKKEIFMSTSFT